MLMIVMRRVRRCGRLLRVMHQAVRCRHAPMRVWPIHTHADGTERRHAHLNGEESDRHGIPAPASSSHGPLPNVNARRAEKTPGVIFTNSNEKITPGVLPRPTLTPRFQEEIASDIGMPRNRPYRSAVRPSSVRSTRVNFFIGVTSIDTRSGLRVILHVPATWPAMTSACWNLTPPPD